jgi:excisionase family DNA binding protein
MLASSERRLVMARTRKQAARELPRMLSTAQVAEIFGRTDRTIRDWIARGLLKPIKVGNSVFIPWAQVDALLSNPKPSKSRSETPKKKPGKPTV